MNYAFDVCLNFNKELYDFYEWNEEDNIIYFLKIPVFKIEEELINDFIKNDVRVDNIFLRKIYNKNQVYFKKNDLHYSCILVTSNYAIGLNFNEKGFIIGKSYLSLEEETEVIEFAKFIKYSIINYKIIRKNNDKERYLTRKEKTDLKNIVQYLNDLQRDKKIDELKYLYYEIFDTIENDYKKIKLKLENTLSSNEEKREKFLEIIKYVC